MEESVGNEGAEAQNVAKKPLRAPLVACEEEHFRAKLAGGRLVRVLFQGEPPTQAEIKKLIAMLELSADQYPESGDAR